MEQKSQQESIINSLKALESVFESCKADYRILGSILIVAHSKKIFRQIGDVDVLLDQENQSCVFNELRRLGFLLQKRKWANFGWIEANKKNYLDLTFLLIGNFTSKHFSCKLNKWLELRIDNDYIAPKGYSFGGVDFIGIPISSVVSGIRQAFLNPKRRLDKMVLKNEVQKYSNYSAYNHIKVALFGKEIPYLYDVFSFFYNIYGGVRLIFGQKFEVWSS